VINIPNRLKKLKNVITALITPFREDFSLDEEKYREFIRFQVDNFASILTMGTTGEAATLSHDEHIEATKIAVDEAKKTGKDPFVLAGTGSNSTKEAISLTARAEKAGADGALIVVPYYNKPVQHSLIDHYNAIAEQVKIPIIIYNVPGRTVRNINPETVATIAKKNDNVVGIKCASGNVDQITKIFKLCPDDFIVLSGDDSLTFHIMALGGKGVIGVASNIIPFRMVEFCEMMERDLWNNARELQLQYYTLFKVLFIETNPDLVKFAAELLGLMNKRMRLPLTPPLKENEDKIKIVLQNLGVLKNHQ